MAKLELVLSPNPILKTKSLPVTKVDKELQKLMDDMLETMYHEDGAGLAAVQIGVLKRIFVLDIGKKEEKETKDPIFFINPEIIYYSEEESTYNEGCLSFPGARSMISRPEMVKIKYLDYDGNHKEMEADNYMARGILHENDHLNGITMPDHLSTIKRDVFLRQVKKFMRNKNND
jgi:peptide deformylase